MIVHCARTLEPNCNQTKVVLVDTEGTAFERVLNCELTPDL